MNCPNCDAEVRESIRFCENCGADLEHATADVASTGASGSTEPLAAAAAAPSAAAQVVTATATPSQTAPGAIRSQVPLIGAVLIAGSAFLPWVSSPGTAATSFSVPFAVVYDVGAPAGGLALGPVILGLGVVAIVLTYASGVRWLQRAIGIVAFVLAAAVAVQFMRSLSDLGISEELFGFLSIGLYLAAVGGALTAFSAR